MPARSRKKTAPEVKQEPSAVGKAAESSQASGYLVVARRYRPQTFEELVGQQHVAVALKNAIKTGRVGHAYLFTGARGVGKTSTARIFAKALNCVTGPTTQPCNQCDICRSISTGDDLDVLEIDGASNRGIEEIRQLRQNAVIRPSRGRYKIYIIDEVHMLTKEAFNALLKTLEEPPEHVKFIFCTTEPNKVPDTILSRCQRFDFLGINGETITARLEQILQAEGVRAEPGVLSLLAQRAAGSMRDAQSLLEQLLAFAEEEIKLQDVYDLLGLTSSDVLHTIAEAAASSNAEKVLQVFHQAVGQGSDPALLLEQLLVFLRDCLVAEVGGPADLFLAAKPHQLEQVKSLAERWGVHRLLAAMQIVDHALFRMRAVTYDRVLAELALIRLARLDELMQVGQLIESLKAGQKVDLISPPRNDAVTGQIAPPSKHNSQPPEHLPPPPLETTALQPAGRPLPPGGAIEQVKQELAQKRQQAEANATSRRSTSVSGEPVPLTQENAASLWKKACDAVGGMTADHARQYHRLIVAGPQKLSVVFRKDREFSQKYCLKREVSEKFVRALSGIVGCPVQIEFILDEEAPSADAPQPVVGPDRSLFDVLQEPMIRKTVEVFGARPITILPPPKAGIVPRATSDMQEDDLHSPENLHESVSDELGDLEED